MSDYKTSNPKITYLSQYIVCDCDGCKEKAIRTINIYGKFGNTLMYVCRDCSNLIMNVNESIDATIDIIGALIDELRIDTGKCNTELCSRIEF
jgi:hypothetical protein